MSKQFATILTILSIIVILGGGVYKFDGRYAKAGDLASTNQSIQNLANVLTKNAQRRELSRLEDQIWGYEQVKNLSGLSEGDKKRLRELEIDRTLLINALGIK